MSETASVSVDGMTVESNSATEEELRETITSDETPDLKKAASDLGKKGGKASAKKRAEAKPEPEPEPEEPESEEETPEESEKTPEDGSERPKKAAKPKDDAEAEEEGEVEEKASEASGKESESETEDEEEKPQKSKRGDPRRDPIARMKEATRKEAEAKTELRRVQRERDEALEMLRSQPRPGQAEPDRGSQTKDGIPQAENFDSFEDYLDARDAYNRRKWAEEFRQEEQERRQAQEGEAAFVKTLNTFHEKMRDIRDDLSGDILFLEPHFTMSDPSQATGPNWLASELVFSGESAPALALHLSEHPDDFQRIAALSTHRDVSRELAKLEARLEAATTGNGTSRGKQVSKASPPVKPVAGAPYIAEDKTETPKSGEEFDDWLRRSHGGRTR